MKNLAGSKTEWIIHFSADDYWQSNPHSRLHLSRALSQTYKILWVNPIGSRIPSMKKKGFRKKIFRKINTLLKPFKKIDDNFYVTTLLIFPSFKKNFIQKVNTQLSKVQIKIIFIALRIKNPILFYTSPIFANTLDIIRHKFSFYYYSDKYSAFREFTQKTRDFIETLDKKIYTNANLIICASQLIYDELKKKTSNEVIYYPHQVDFKLFNNTNNLGKPEDLQNIQSPVIGYYGTLTDSNDWEIIKYCADNRPNYNFVFIGRKDIPDTGLERYKNVFFLGKKSYSEIPVYGSFFDVAIMFWIRREWIKNCSPLKLKEYLSLGKPVVSTVIEEIVKYYSDIIYLADNKEQFLEALDNAINLDNTVRISKGIDKVKNDSWSTIVPIIEKYLNNDSKI